MIDDVIRREYSSRLGGKGAWMSEISELGKYRVLAKLGRGGFATVYRAIDTTLDREVAIKVLEPLFMRDYDWVARFRREAKVAARVVHPHIVTIYEIGEAADRLYISMQLARGGSLANRILQEGSFSWTETLDIMESVCDALTRAHNMGLVHRDLKPENILLDPDLGPLIVDFGFAHLMGSNSLTVNMSSGGVVGTPAYIAPEVWETGQAGVPADIYALGCIVYEMLMGKVLFSGTPVQAMRAHDRGVDVQSSGLDAIFPGLSSVIARSLSKHPSHRFDTPMAIWDALADLDKAKKSPRNHPGTEVPVDPRLGDEWVNPIDGKTMVYVPDGDFLYGDKLETRRVADYWIDKTPVTNREYQRFVAADERQAPLHWTENRPLAGTEDHPVVYVSWNDAVAYCAWAEKQLPSEEEWEKAARGVDGRLYPWGPSAPSSDSCNFDGQVGGTTPVASYSPEGDSPYGCTDMAGSVEEWTQDLYCEDQDRRVTRGGSWFSTSYSVCSTARDSSRPTYVTDSRGFRCIKRCV